MSVVDKLIKQFIDNGYASTETIIGCSDTEINAIEQAQQVILPEIYREFLSKMGKKAGSFNRGTDIFYPALLELKNWMMESLEGDHQAAFRLPPNAFVFKSHQGYMFSFFVCSAGEDDPFVFNYDEFRTPVPIPLNHRYSEWLEITSKDPGYF